MSTQTLNMHRYITYIHTQTYSKPMQKYVWNKFHVTCLPFTAYETHQYFLFSFIFYAACDAQFDFINPLTEQKPGSGQHSSLYANTSSYFFIKITPVNQCQLLYDTPCRWNLKDTPKGWLTCKKDISETWMKGAAGDPEQISTLISKANRSLIAYWKYSNRLLDRKMEI